MRLLECMTRFNICSVVIKAVNEPLSCIALNGQGASFFIDGSCLSWQQSFLSENAPKAAYETTRSWGGAEI